MTKHRHLLSALLLALPAPEAQSEQYTCVSFEYLPLIQKGTDGTVGELAI